MVRAAIPGVAISTDIIVGFPGETDDEFDETLSLVAEARYDAAFTFQYSPRPMAEAADMDGQVPKAVVQERFERLTALQDALSLERNQRHLGEIHEVIVEGASKKNPSRLSGRTRHNKLVHFQSDGARDGSFRTVMITGAHSHYLEGELTSGRSEDPRAERSRDQRRARVSLPLAGVAATGSEGCV
jgi:tRNA-2-methylthio-N6-dimethylallyladenosine synthase